MKVNLKLCSFAARMLFVGTLAWSHISCSNTVSTKEKSPVGEIGTNPNLVGGWILEGELRSLSLNKNGTCELVSTDNNPTQPLDPETLEGTWKQKGNLVTLSLNDEWRGKKIRNLTFKETGTYDTTADGKRYPSQVLLGNIWGEEQALFARVWPLAPEYQ